MISGARSLFLVSVSVSFPLSLAAGALVSTLAGGCGSSETLRASFDDRDPTDPANGLGGGGGFGGDASDNMLLDPKNATVIIDTAPTPPVPGTVSYKVTLGGKDVTGSSKFTLDDPSLGTFSGSTFTSVPALPAGALGKSTTVVVQTEGGQGLGTLTVVQLRKTGPQRDFFFVVPYGGEPSPTNDVLNFSTNIKQADVAFLMDTTGSMTSAINNLKSALAGTLLAQLQAAIPNVGLAVVDYKDFGSFDPWAVLVRQVVTTSLPAAQSAVNAMTASGGGDLPEAAVGAMFFAMTGQANNGSPPVAAHTAPAGTFGGVDFRSGSVPVLVNITDASWNDPSGSATVPGLKSAITAARAKFVQITTGVSSFPEAQADDLADATGSYVPPAAFGTVPGCAAGQCCTGVNGAGRAPTGPGGTCRLNFLSSNGSGVSGGIVKAIEAIAIGSSYDVTAVASNDPQNAKGVDATKFIKALRAMDEGSMAEGCPAGPAKDSDGDGIKDTFVDLKAGTPACFEIIPAKNTTVPPELEPQFFNAFVDVMAVQGNLKLDTRSVRFLVPPKDAGVK